MNDKYQPIGHDGLRLKPQRPRKAFDVRRSEPDFWFYEETHGLAVCAATSEGVMHCVIPTSAIRGYLKRRES